MIFSVSVMGRTIRYNGVMVESWFFLQSRAGTAAMNMALDEALLRTTPQRSRPLLRVYTWERPAVSFGYFQKFPAQLADSHALVRRPTGGGVVYHETDTTYTVIVPPGHALYEMSAADAYRALHEAIAAALSEAPTLHAAGTASLRGQYECFQNPVRGDVMADGRKLAGGAQRRTKWGLLHQGSIARQITAAQLCRGFEQTLGVGFQSYELTSAEQSLAGQLAHEKYGSATWNQRISR
jgi:lipoate-protein ligase A